MKAQANNRPRSTPVDLAHERIQRAVEALEDAEKSLASTQEQLRVFEISQVHLRAAYDSLRQVEKSLWDARRRLNTGDVDRFILYEIQDILTNPDSEASLPTILAMLRTVYRLAGQRDDTAQERVDSATEKMMLPGVGQVLARVEEVRKKLPPASGGA